MQSFKPVSRRSFLRAAALGAIYRFQIGDFQLISVSDGTLTVPAALFASTATPEQLQQVLLDSYQTADLTLHCNVLYVDN